mmetsp:Transcript_32729/g.43490  ORF Transcript_32729/g.43490 Transcript_32729/m.43490 type:complete len:275 (-) Transcript_32729:347-1171(-)
MRFTDTTVALLFLLGTFNDVSSFVTVAPPSFATSTTRLQMSSEAPAPKKKLTAADVIAKAGKPAAVAGEAEDEAAPKIFEDGLLDDMQACLLTLEKRVKEGPGSIEVEEISAFEAGMNRILEEMLNPRPPVEEGADPAAKTPSSSMAFESVSLDQSSPPLKKDVPPPPPPPQASSAPEEPKKEVVMEEDGPAYDGKGGMGLSTGTRNTYVIPGMDEMSPEEYREALQKSVSDRQEQRRLARSGVVGNRAAHSYLDQLGWGGASKNLSGENSKDE